MSYRAFKRLLGETSLERKCRFLFGVGILVLITISFGVYANRTEHLAYEQATTTCRLLVNPILAQRHVPSLRQKMDEKWDRDQLRSILNLADNNLLKEKGQEYQYHILNDLEFLDSFERDLFKKFRSDPETNEDSRLRSSEHVLLYYGAVRASKSCLSCHQKIATEKGRKAPEEGEVLAVVRIRMSTKAIESGVHLNRALLIATALATAISIMVGSWFIVRYIIVKPVKHLKDVSDAISAGELNVRSEIQTGDEFEDLSHAFNRMLRNLVSMQDQYRKVNTDLDRKVDELAQANMALYESNRLKNDFLTTMSHELRTPLNSIIGFSEVLVSQPNLSDKQKRWVSNIQSSGDQLLNLINDILDLAKIEAGKMELRLEEFSFHDLSEGLFNMFRPLAAKKNIDMRTQIAPDIPLMRQDVTKLQQILQNLISNAIKFTPQGGRVILHAEVEGKSLVVKVIDTGVGIAPDEQDYVFEKFRQADSPLTREHTGTGLGLSIVRELTKLLGGEVSLQSEIGRGSTFTLRLPLKLTGEPKFEFRLTDEHVDLTKAKRVDVRLFAGRSPASPDKVDGASRK